jgi:hypothetical protein
MTDLTAKILPELFARLGHPTVRLSGSVDEAAAASFLSQVLPALDVPGSIVVELFSAGGDAEVGRRLTQEVRLLRHAHGRDMWFPRQDPRRVGGGDGHGGPSAGSALAHPRHHAADPRTAHDAQRPPGEFADGRWKRSSPTSTMACVWRMASLS